MVDVKEFPDYVVYEDGLIVHKESQAEVVARVHEESHHIFCLLQHPEGYCQYRMIARLVAEAYLPNPNGYTSLLFKDKCFGNVHVSNLEWVEDINKREE
jgi:hypothetical protein